MGTCRTNFARERYIIIFVVRNLEVENFSWLGFGRKRDVYIHNINRYVGGGRYPVISHGVCTHSSFYRGSSTKPLGATPLS